MTVRVMQRPLIAAGRSAGWVAAAGPALRNCIAAAALHAAPEGCTSPQLCQQQPWVRAGRVNHCGEWLPGPHCCCLTSTMKLPFRLMKNFEPFDTCWTVGARCTTIIALAPASALLCENAAAIVVWLGQSTKTEPTSCSIVAGKCTLASRLCEHNCSKGIPLELLNPG